MTSFSIVFNPGEENELTISSGDNLESLTINHSNESYYKDAEVALYNIPDFEEKVSINSRVNIYIDGHLEFSGYVSRIQTRISGVKIFYLQCIGRTYDLWRFMISGDTYFEKKYSAYIVSSLVAQYCSGHGIYITPPDVRETDGSYIEYIDVSLMAVGDAIARIAKFDGHHFFVDEYGKLRYYTVSSSVQFTVTTSDILEMEPLEHSDDYIRNDVLVVGSQQYEQIIPDQLPPFTSGNWIWISSATTFVAQQFGVPALETNRLTSLKLRATRSKGKNTPLYLAGDIRNDNSGEPGSIVASSNTITWHGVDIQADPSGTWLPFYTFSNHLYLSGGAAYWAVFHFPGASSNIWWKLSYSPLPDYTDVLSSEPTLYGTWDYGSIDYGDVVYDSGNNEVDFVAKPRGYASANTFLQDITPRTRYFYLPSSLFTDEINFLAKVRIDKYESGNKGLGNYRRTDDGRYRPRFMIGLCDMSHPAKPMFGFEFDL